MNTNHIETLKRQYQTATQPEGQTRDDKYGILGGKAGRICEELERRLSRGFYKFGESISTVELVEEFGASRAPVTTALNHLRSSGYLIITPQVGCRVVSPSKREIADFFQLFGAVEGIMAGFAAERSEPGEVDMLKDISQRIRKVTPKKRESISDIFLDLLSLFHETIRAIARSPLEARRVAAYWQMSEFLLFNGLENGEIRNLGQANKERDAIIAAIEARDVEAAKQHMEEHVRGKPLRTGTL